MMPMTPMQQRRAFVVGLMYYPSLTLQIFLRKKSGFRHLKHSRIVGLTLLLLAVAYVAGNVPASFNPFSRSPAAIASEGAAAPSAANPPADDYKTAPDGLDSPLPANWTRMDAIDKAMWIRKHQLSPQQLAQRHAREAKEAEQRQQQQAAAAQAQQDAATRRESMRQALTKLPLNAFAVLFFAWGMIQHHLRWRDLLTGVRWHTRSRGVSFLKPVLANVMREPNIMRFADPLLGFGIGIAFYSLLSHALGLWLMFAAVAFYIVEQHVYEQELERSLDQLDNLVESEIVEEGVRHFKGGPAQAGGPSVEDTAGVPTGIAPELEDQIARRKERRERERAKKYPPPPPELLQAMREHHIVPAEQPPVPVAGVSDDIAPPAIAASDIAPPSEEDRL